MILEYNTWLAGNSQVLEPLVKILSDVKRRDPSILVLGPYSLIPAMIVKDMLPDSTIYAFADEEAKAEFRHDTDEDGAVQFTSKIASRTYDLIFGLFFLDSIAKSQAVRTLFDLKEALSEEGILHLVLEDASFVVPGEGELREAWFSEGVKVFRKLYTLPDLVHTLSLIGFRISDMEEVEVEGLSHVSALTMRK